MIRHEDVSLGSIHTPFNWVYANATARTSARNFASGDVNKIALELATGSIWAVTAVAGDGTPTWTSVGGGGGSASIPTLDQVPAAAASVGLNQQKITNLGDATNPRDAVNLETAEALLAAKASPAFTGTPTAPEQPAGDNSANLATTSYADRAVFLVLASLPNINLIPTWLYEANGTYPLRSVATGTSSPVMWVGVDAPPIGSGYAVNDVDLWTPRRSDMSVQVGYPYRAHNGVWVPNTGASLTPGSAPVPSDARVSSRPTGPAAPADGWKVVMADGFNQANGLWTDVWYPNRYRTGGGHTYAPTDDVPGFNSNEVGVFNSSQVAVTGNGCELTAVCISNTKSTAAYRSGVINSDPNQGQRMGFQWKPALGQILVHESVIKIPALAGSDLGYWGDLYFGASGKQEIDLFEQFNWGNLGEMAIADWFGSTASGTAYGAGLEYYLKDNPGANICADGSTHRWTHKFDGINQTVSIYLDGVLMPHLEDPHNGFVVGSGTYSWPANWNSTGWENLMYSYGLRDVTPASGASPPPYVVGTTDKTIVRSYVCYLNGTANPSLSVTGGGIAPGTTVT